MLQQKQVKSVLNKHKKRDKWFLDDYSVNPYEECNCNCLYCYVRGSKYGENMDDGLFVKANAPDILEKQLRSRANKNEHGIVVVGSATDAYMPHEKEWRITEAILKLLLKYRFPVFISTKRDLIKRDIQLLKEIDEAAILPADLKTSLKRGLILSVSVSGMDETMTNMLEPGAIAPLQRMQLLRELKHEGFLAGVNAIPVLPYISDTQEELERIISSAKEHEADYVLTGGLTLFGNERADSKTLYYTFLGRYRPSLIAEYDKLYGNYPFTPRWYQQDLEQRAHAICEKYFIRNSIV
jgi:DNA repair photolyase